MNATLSTRQLRLVALLVGIVILAAGYLVVSRHNSTSPTTASSTPASTTPAATTPTSTTPAQTTPAPSKAHTHAVTPVRLDTHGLPVQVAHALQKHSVVVVSLAAPQDQIDQLSAGEARAAAADMHAGYVYIDVYHQQPGTTLLRKLGVFNTPATLVVKRGGNVYAEFRGWADRDVVVQAIGDARS